MFARAGFDSSSGSRSSHPSLSLPCSSSIPFSSSPQPSVDVGDVGTGCSAKSAVELTWAAAVDGVSIPNYSQKINEINMGKCWKSVLMERSCPKS